MLYRLFYALNFDPDASAYCPIPGLSARKSGGASDHTIRCYRSDLNQMRKYMTEASYEEPDLTPSSRSGSVLGGRMVKEGKSPRTIHRKVSVYRTFVKYARAKA